jgi:outer membrane murein-binding lipoprotein Lpp
MKAWLAVAALTVIPLTGCGNSRELNKARLATNAARKDADTLRAENNALKTKVTELEMELAAATKERDELKAAAEAPPPAATPASGKKRKK